MDISKVNKAVRLKCQIEAIHNKLVTLLATMTNEERNEYQKRCS